MNKVLIIQNDPPETLGLYESYLRENTEVTLIKAYKMRENQQFPDVDDFSHFLIGPTPISANDTLKHKFLKKEWEYLQKISDSNKPCLGICCGGQMLAKLLGGTVKASPRKEVGGYTVTLTTQGKEDPLFIGFPDQFPVFHWHSDMFTVPPGGKQLVVGDPCPIQAFSKNNIWGLIFHLEITPKDAERWANAYPQEPLAIGKTREQVINECIKHESQMYDLSQKLMKNFLSQNQINFS